MSDRLSGQQFVELAGKSGILTQDDLDSAVSAISHNDELPSVAATVADWLVKNDTLTRWQADKLMAGNHNGLILSKYKLVPARWGRFIWPNKRSCIDVAQSK